MEDFVSRQAAANALCKALYEYEDKTEKQFQESDELDIGDWILHRIFVQNMNDIDRQTIINLPSVDAVEVVRCKDCKYWDKDWMTIEGCHYCGMVDKQTEGNFFCGDGERKEE